MKTREMVGPRDWHSEGSVRFHAASRATEKGSLWPVRVLVTEIPEGMPDFKPGDRVIRGSGSGPYEVEAIYRDRNGRWCAVLDTMSAFIAVFADDLTKLPREITRTIRVTGPEDAVNEVVAQVERHPRRAFDVRVEVTDAD